MCKYKAREIAKGNLNELRAAIKDGCVVERKELSGNYMQIFSNCGNNLKRTYRPDTQQWGSISLCRNLNWMGRASWFVIQTEDGKDLRFNGDTSSFKVQPPFMMRDCEYEAEEPEQEEEEEEPEVEEETEAEPELKPEVVESMADMVMRIAHELAAKYNLDVHRIIQELTAIQKARQFKEIGDVVKVFETNINKPMVMEERTRKAGDCIVALLDGHTVRINGVRYRIDDAVLMECRQGQSVFQKSQTSFNTMFNADWVLDEFPLTFSEAVEFMESGRTCVPESMNVRFRVADGCILRVDKAPGIPLAILDGKWRIYEA